jgi:hypothetical protein
MGIYVSAVALLVHAIALLLIGATIRTWFRRPRSYERSAIDEAGRDLATAN